MKEILIILTLFVLGGCQSSAALIADCKGSAVALNPEHWQPAVSDLKPCFKIVQGSQ